MEDTTKQCYSCKFVLKLDSFNKCTHGTFGVHGHCRNCQKEHRRAWYLKNRESEKLKAAAYSKTPIAKTRRARYWADNKDKLKLRNNTRRKTLEAKTLARIQRSKWMAIPQNAIAHNLRSRIRVAMKGVVKSASTEKLLGCSFIELKKHLEGLFSGSMSWENYGTVWHIDHIVPLSYLDVTQTKNQQLLCHYLNLQPLSVSENLSKNNRIDQNLAEQVLEQIRRVLP